MSVSDKGEDTTTNANGGGEGGEEGGSKKGSVKGSVDLDDLCPEKVLETAPFDPRFPNTNQTKYCYVSFLDYHRCIKLRGEDYQPCQYFYRVFKSMCPNAWVEKWNEQIENGTFPAKI